MLCRPGEPSGVACTSFTYSPTRAVLAVGAAGPLPMMGSQLRLPVDAVVTASDASEHGLGLSRTLRLSQFGSESLDVLDDGGDGALHELERGPFRSSAAIIVFSLFDGIGGLRRSLQRLHLRVLAYFSVECETAVRRCLRQAWPGVIEATDVCSVTRQDVECLEEASRARTYRVSTQVASASREFALRFFASWCACPATLSSFASTSAWAFVALPSAS